jgi:arylsulfatase
VPHDYLWWLHEGSRAIRIGDYKLVAASPSLRGRGAAARQETPGAWELFDLSTDRAETNNLAAKLPDKVRELEQLGPCCATSFQAGHRGSPERHGKQ